MEAGKISQQWTSLLSLMKILKATMPGPGRSRCGAANDLTGDSKVGDRKLIPSLPILQRVRA